MDYTINGKVFHSIDSLTRITTKDSFTDRENKLGNGAGAWEWHIGSKNDAAKYAFFGGPGFDVKCFLQKSDLLWLMNEMKGEYINPSQHYRSEATFPQIYQNRLAEVRLLSDISYFKFREHDTRLASDNRLYAKRPGTTADGDEIYGLIRKLGLPDITFTSILKLQATDGEILYYFKIFPEFSPDDQESPLANTEIAAIEVSTAILPTEKSQLIKSRIGQGKFRAGIFLDSTLCPVTLVDDTRLLVASHIKPWSVSSNAERLDPKNGFLFTPTIDKLFDAGYISFTDTQELMISPWISNETKIKLNLIDGRKYPLLPVNGREIFLKYHREHIFKT